MCRAETFLRESLIQSYRRQVCHTIIIDGNLLLTTVLLHTFSCLQDSSQWGVCCVCPVCPPLAWVFQSFQKKPERGHLSRRNLDGKVFNNDAKINAGENSFLGPCNEYASGYVLGPTHKERSPQQLFTNSPHRVNVALHGPRSVADNKKEPNLPNKSHSLQLG